MIDLLKAVAQEQLTRDSYIAEAEEAIESIKRVILADHAPVKIGQVVTSNSGTYCGKDMQVTMITVEVQEKTARFRAAGQVLKVNGKPGAIMSAWSQLVTF